VADAAYESLPDVERARLDGLRALHYEPSSQRTMHRTTIAGDEAWT
jgi:hypothetical protein